MRSSVAFLLLAACGAPAMPAGGDDVPTIDAPAAVDAPNPVTGFGDLSGMCDVLDAADLAAATPSLIHGTFTFERAYVDPDDRPLLTPGGLRLAETPNAGGSSGLSEVFAYEWLTRCEHANLLKTETEIVYDTAGKITDLEVSIENTKIGVSVTRAVAFPFGSPYTLDAATMLIRKKLEDIQLSTANVSAADRWQKQFLAVLAWDAAAAVTVEEAWNGLDAATRADTIVIVTATDGEDLFIYSNN